MDESKSTRVTMRLPADVLAALNPEPERLTPRVCDVARRYRKLVRHALPELSTPEWTAIFDALNGTDMLNEMHEGMCIVSDSADTIHASVADSGPGCAQFGVDHLALARKLYDMAPAQRIAVAEVARAFWVHGGGIYTDTDAMVQSAINDACSTPDEG